MIGLKTNNLSKQLSEILNDPQNWTFAIDLMEAKPRDKNDWSHHTWNFGWLSKQQI